MKEAPEEGVFGPLAAGVLERDGGAGRFVGVAGFFFSAENLDFAFCRCLSLQV